MLFLIYFILTLVAIGLLIFVKGERVRRGVNWSFYAIQAMFVIYAIMYAVGETHLDFFTTDKIGLLFMGLMALTSPVIYHRSITYLDMESPREKGVFNSLSLLLCVLIACVYFSNNIVVTWIFLEATTLCTAGLIYHRRTPKSLEATWKYVFVCSVGIAIAYLGVLLMGGVALNGDLSYTNLAANVSVGNPLFMKIAFLFILAGYSSKLEVFPLYNIGVDANVAAPTPASALISSALVNAGFVSIYRVYKVMERSMIFDWASNVLIIAGLASVIIGAVFMRRANHFKRLLSYSTVENMGIVLIGLGVGGLGVFAAIFHVAGHSLLKSSLFIQMADVGKTYGHYQVRRAGDYMNVDDRAASLILITSILLLAFPPSPLFISEVMIMKQMVINGQWVQLGVVVLLLCLVIYNFGRRILKLCYKPISKKVTAKKTNIILTITVFSLLVIAMVFGVWQPEWLVGWIYDIAL